MRNRLYKMLMNQEGGSPGGGSQQPPAPGTQPAPASGSAPAPGAAPTFDTSKIVNDIATQVRDGVFAQLRKAGVLKGKDDDGGDGGKAADPAVTTQQPAGLSAADVEQMLDRARVFERTAAEHKLTDAQRKRMDAAMRTENPSDLAAWSKSYLEDMGIAKAPNPNGGTGTAPPARGPNLSDRGTPARDSSLATQGEVWKMTPADVQQLIREKGYQGAAQELRARFRQDLQGRRLLMPRPGGH